MCETSVSVLRIAICSINSSVSKGLICEEEKKNTDVEVEGGQTIF